MRRAVYAGLILLAVEALGTSPALASTKNLRAKMTAEEVVDPAGQPSPGPAGAKGRTDLAIESRAGKVCYRLALEAVEDTPTGVHVHRGVKSAPGNVVIELNYAQNGNRGCVNANSAVLSDIKEHPEQYYVDVHTDRHPNGAVRGQVSEGCPG